VIVFIWDFSGLLFWKRLIFKVVVSELEVLKQPCPFRGGLIPKSLFARRKLRGGAVHFKTNKK
jgi:hypothetical protein